MADAAMDRVAEMMEMMAARELERVQRGGREREYKAPEYNGQGDIEYFIRQFLQVAEANDWPGAAVLIHLRESLKEEARECGRAEDVDGILVNLRSRFGMTRREARSQLAVVCKDYATTLQEHSKTIEQLINIAYDDLPHATRVELAVDLFSTTLGNAYLQRHLLAVPTPTLEAAVRAGNEFLQVKVTREARPVRQLEEDEREPCPRDGIQAVHAPADPLNTMLLVMQQMGDVLAKLQVAQEKTDQKVRAALKAHPSMVEEETPARCWGCGQAGHFRSNCPDRRPAQNQRKAGNGVRPQQ